MAVSLDFSDFIILEGASSLGSTQVVEILVLETWQTVFETARKSGKLFSLFSFFRKRKKNSLSYLTLHSLLLVLIFCLCS